jgi:hypothetical protein
MANVKYTDEFPLFFDSRGQISNPGWVNLSNAYPAVVGAPAANEAEVRITAGSHPAGTYELNMSGTYEVDSSTNDAQLRFSLDGGATWEEFSRGATSGVRSAFAYAFPLPQTVGSFDFVMQVKKENSQNTMQLYFASIWFKRMK